MTAETPDPTGTGRAGTAGAGGSAVASETPGPTAARGTATREGQRSAGGSDAAKISDLRHALPVLGSANYLNTGTTGPLPSPVASAMARTLESQAAYPRTGREYFELVDSSKAACREELAAMLGCSPSEIALTHNTTEGLNFITLGVNWTRGDEAITTDVEHPGVLLPLWVVRERYGVTVKVANLLGQPCDPVDAVVRHITPRTKLISLSHVSYSTGEILPVAEIAAEAHRRGVLVLVDGAQSFGAIPVDVRGLGADFYSVPGQKWLCGPEGTGALYSSQAAISQIRTTFASYGTMDDYNDHGGMLVKEDGRRFEQGTTSLADLEGQAAAARWHREAVGQAWAYRRIGDLARLARGLLEDLDGVNVITPPLHAGLVSFALASVGPASAGPGSAGPDSAGPDSAGLGSAGPDTLVAELAKRSILVRSIRRPAGVRISTGFFNTEEEIAAALAAIAEILAGMLHPGHRA